MAAAASSSVWLVVLQQQLPHSFVPAKSSTSACYPPVYTNKKRWRGSLLLCSSSSDTAAFLSYRDDPNFRGCKGCGREQLEPGCNGEGRIQGGIAAVPGFGWWPIKAYRPCPGFVSSGGRYRRQGQSMDDVASGRAKKTRPSSSSSTNN